MDDIAITCPQWTEAKKKNGLDPLGMQNTSIGLYQNLLPGLNNVTLRMRYYGFYVWLCRTYLKDGSDDLEHWKRFIRRGEALYALVARHAGGESGIAGSNWANRIYNETGKGRIDFAAAADPDSKAKYLDQPWGAYGAAYRNQLFEVQIFWDGKSHQIPVPSPELGEHLAQAFEAELGEVATRFATILTRGDVSFEELEELLPIVPSEIERDGNERTLYQRVLLEPSDEADAGAKARRQSMLLLLHIVAFLGSDIVPDQARWVLYSSHDEEGRRLPELDAEAEAQRQCWWAYQGNELCHIAYETLLKFTLDTLAPHRSGLRPQLLTNLVVERLLTAMPSVPESWDAFVETVQAAENAYGEDAHSEWSLSQGLLRSAGREDDSNCLPKTALLALTLLAVLQKRARANQKIVNDVLSEFSGGASQTLLTECRFLDRNGSAKFDETIGRIVNERVIRRHLWVAARKFQNGDYTFLIEVDDGRYRLRRKDGPVFTTPRLGPALTFLRDIHLIGEQGLTQLGAEALAN